MKPIYISLAAWGAPYIDAMCVHLIRSLLTPRNAELLKASDGHRFVVATTKEDWERFRAAPEFALLSPHMEPDYVELSAKPAGVTVYRHMTDAHRRLVEKAAAERVFSCMLAPDVYLSEGFVETLIEHAERGTEVLLISAWHVAQRKLFNALRAQKLSFTDPRTKVDAIRPGLDALTLGQLAANAIHPCVACMEWDSPSFDESATFVWWRLPGEPGLLLHCMFWVEMGLDYSAIETHGTQALECSTIEALYVQENFGETPKIAVIDRGARAFVCSWKEDDLIAEGTARLSYEEYVASRARRRLPMIAGFMKGVRLRFAFYRATSQGRDFIKRRLIFHPVVWGRTELGDADLEVEKRAQKVLRTYIGDFDPDRPLAQRIVQWPWFALLTIAMNMFRAVNATKVIHWPFIRSYLKVIAAALRGDQSAWRQIQRRLSTISGSFLGRSH